MTKSASNRTFDFHNQLASCYGNHRSGWSYVLSAFEGMHNPDGLFFDTFVERTYVWGQALAPKHRSWIPDKEWVGFIHNPTIVPEWFDRSISNKNIFSLPAWQESFKLCRGLFTLSRYHKNYLDKILDVPVDVVYHPMDDPSRKWSFADYLNNKEKSLVQIGWWLRNLHGIFELPEGDFKKIFLKPKNEPWFETLFKANERERTAIGKFTPSMYETAETYQFLPDRQYDDLLSSNIGFIYLYNASANNAITECIARNTPLLVNKIPPVVEYLGEGYPFYYDSYEEALDKAHDIDLVHETHQYLKYMPEKERFSLEAFRERVCSSPILSDDSAQRSPSESRLPAPIRTTNTISIVTPCLNDADDIDQVVMSVLTQAGDFAIRYHVQDGGSTDGTLEKLSNWKQRLDSGEFPVQCNGVEFSFASSAESSQLGRVVTGFQNMYIANDGFMTWVPPRCSLLSGAFEYISKIGCSLDVGELDWLISPPVGSKNDFSDAAPKIPFPREIVRKGVCDGTLWPALPLVGFFFRNSLWKAVEGANLLSSSESADLSYLWTQFAGFAEPIHTKARLVAKEQDADIDSERKIELFNEELRKGAFEALVSEGDLSFKAVRLADDIIKIVRLPAQSVAVEFYEAAFGRKPKLMHATKKQEATEVLCQCAVEASPRLNSFHFYTYTSKKVDEFSGKGQTFYLTTPVLNGGADIDETILSVISQRGDFWIRYHVQDGNSSDFTVERLQYWEKVLSRLNPYVQCNGVEFSWASDGDRGRFHAVNIALDRLCIPGNAFMGWVDCGKPLADRALQHVMRVTDAFPEINWISGGDKSQIDARIATQAIALGLHDDVHFKDLSTEQMFFKKSLWFAARYAVRGFSYAGAWNCWREFAKRTSLYRLDAPLIMGRPQRRASNLDALAAFVREIDAVIEPIERERRFAEVIESAHECRTLKCSENGEAPEIIGEFCELDSLASSVAARG